jgi:hypothetical protein
MLPYEGYQNNMRCESDSISMRRVLLVTKIIMPDDIVSIAKNSSPEIRNPITNTTFSRMQNTSGE